MLFQNRRKHMLRVVFDENLCEFLLIYAGSGIQAAFLIEVMMEVFDNDFLQCFTENVCQGNQGNWPIVGRFRRVFIWFSDR